MTVYFYSQNKEFGCFSNFSSHGFNLDDKFWATSEHYFQAQKFFGTKHYDVVMNAASPGDAAKIGRDRDLPLRPDWEHVKDDIMRRALYAKFKAHDDIREMLLSTGKKKIVEKTREDYYWGCGSDGTGLNRLGVLLMEIREQIRNEQLVDQ